MEKKKQNKKHSGDKQLVVHQHFHSCSRDKKGWSRLNSSLQNKLEHHFFPAFLAAHLAFIRAESLALAAALIVNFFFAGLTAWVAGSCPALILAHLAFWAAAILALPAA